MAVKRGAHWGIANFIPTPGERTAPESPNAAFDRRFASIEGSDRGSPLNGISRQADKKRCNANDRNFLTRRSMAPARLLFFLAAPIVMLFGANTAKAESITSTWLGAEVAFILPDVVTYGEAFDISFSIDTATAEPSITLAFMTFLDMSDTLTAAGSAWEYEFISNEDPWSLVLSGDFGDATTPTTHDADGYSSRFYDPIQRQLHLALCVLNIRPR
jgi:hypothetical protein